MIGNRTAHGSAKAGCISSAAIVILLALLFAATTPSKAEHNARLKAFFQEELKKGSGADGLASALSKLGGAAIFGLADWAGVFEYRNYFFISVTELDGDIASFGFLRMVFINRGAFD